MSKFPQKCKRSSLRLTAALFLSRPSRHNNFSNPTKGVLRCFFPPSTPDLYTCALNLMYCKGTHFFQFSTQIFCVQHKTNEINVNFFSPSSLFHCVPNCLLSITLKLKFKTPLMPEDQFLSDVQIESRARRVRPYIWRRCLHTLVRADDWNRSFVWKHCEGSIPPLVFCVQLAGERNAQHMSRVHVLTKPIVACGSDLGVAAGRDLARTRTLSSCQGLESKPPFSSLGLKFTVVCRWLICTVL